MPLPSLMPPFDQTLIRNQRGDQDRPDLRHGEPGTWWNNRRNDVESFIFSESKQIDDFLLGGDDPTQNDGDFVLTVTPVKTQTGSAGSDGLAPASITLPTLTGITLADVVQGLIDLAEDGATLLDAADVNAWSQLIRFVTLSISGTTETLRVEALNTGATFNVTLTTTVAGVTVTPTSVSAPGTTTLKVGCYAAIDRAKGTNGLNKQGKKHVKVMEPTTPGADIVGPVWLGNGTEPVESNFPFREYTTGVDVSGALYGDPLVYAELAIPAGSTGPVYARHTDGGDFLRGMAANQATAEAGATAAVATVTPVSANSTLYEFDVLLAGVVIGRVRHVSAAAASATLIADAFREQLSANAFSALTLDAATGSPVVITGPADGRTVVLTPTAANVGDNGIVATTPAVSTHTIVARGDKFAAESLRIGSAPITIPHPF